MIRVHHASAQGGYTVRLVSERIPPPRGGGRGGWTVFTASHPALSGCEASARSIADALAKLDRVRDLHLQDLARMRLPIPAPDTPPAGEYTPPAEPLWVHTLSYHSVGSVFGWPSADSPTGWWSGIVRENTASSVKVDDIRPGMLSR